jgi:hypothetical protein
MKYVLIAIICLSGCPAFAGPFQRFVHNRTVAKTGIVPNQVGQFEGVGRSPHSFEHAQSVACYANSGMRVVSVQRSITGGMYNVVVRYQK